MSRIPTFFRLIQKLPSKKESFFWIILTSVMTNILSLVIPIYFMHVYDKIIPNKSEYTLIIITVGAVVIIILDALFVIGRGVLSSWYAAKFSYATSSLLIKSLFSLTNSEYYKNPTSEYNECFRSVEKLKRVYAGQLFQSLLDIPFIFVFLFGIYYISGKLVYYHLIVLALFILIITLYYHFSSRFRDRATAANNRRFDLLESVLKRIHPLKSQGFEEMILRKLEEAQRNYSYNYLSMKNSLNLPSSLGAFFSQLMIYGTIVIGGVMAVRGELSFGVISAATMLSRRTVGPLLSISRLSQTISQSRSDLNRVDRYLRDSVNLGESVEFPENIDGLLEIRNLNLKKVDTIYGNLNNIQLEADEGKITGIICNDSSAASIFVDTILGIEKPDSGEILLDSMKLTGYKEIINFPDMVVIPRNTELFMGTILDNITLFKPHLSTQALDAAAFLGLDVMIAKLPLGYETEITPFSDKTLPNSIIKRISIVRALVKRPRVIISNQADSGMNEETKKLYIDVLKRLSLNTTIIIISDDHSFLDHADDLYLLSDSELHKLEESLYE